MTVFMGASWRRLAMVTWVIPDEVLAPLLPPGTEPDRWDGRALASLVAFEFSRTRIFGVHAVGFRFFPEWNLRFYVRERGADGRRGVVFVKEMIPSAFVSAIARLSYGEPYAGVPYEYEVSAEGSGFSARHAVHVAGRAQELRVLAGGEASFPSRGSLAFHLTQVPFGFRERGGRLTSYAVDHAPWRVWPSCEISLGARTADLYGESWAFLEGLEPLSRLVAEGSDDVKVHLPRRGRITA